MHLPETNPAWAHAITSIDVSILNHDINGVMFHIKIRLFTLADILYTIHIYLHAHLSMTNYSSMRTVDKVYKYE